MNRFAVRSAPEYAVVVLTGAVEVDIAASFFVGAVNLATAAQTATVQVYDGASSGGAQVSAANALPVNGAVSPPAPGIRLTSGTLGIKPSAAPTAPGIAFYYVP